jgi:hypothetical protein
MNFKGKFNFLGQIDISAIKKLVLSLTEENWNEVSWRQERYSVHQFTQTISLMFDQDFRHENPTKHKFYQLFEKSIQPLISLIDSTVIHHSKQDISTTKKSYPVRINLVRLLPNGSIPVHNDKNHSLSHSHRIHIPIITNENVIFTVDNKEIHMKEGEVYEINNRLLHTVRNEGTEIRTHMIIDWVIPGEKCCCGIKHNPETLCSPETCHNFNFTPILCGCFDN